MFTFNSPVIYENLWNICLKTKKELNEIYYEDIKTEKEENIEGLIDFSSLTIYIDKNLDDVLFRKSLRKQLINLYLWETGQQNHLFTEEDFCDLASVAAPLICKTADDIVLGLEKNVKK